MQIHGLYASSSHGPPFYRGNNPSFAGRNLYVYKNNFENVHVSSVIYVQLVILYHVHKVNNGSISILAASASSIYCYFHVNHSETGMKLNTSRSSYYF